MTASRARPRPLTKVDTLAFKRRSPMRETCRSAANASARAQGVKPASDYRHMWLATDADRDTDL